MILIQINDFSACPGRQALIDAELELFGYEPDRAIRDEEVGIAEVRSRNVAIVRVGAVGSMSGLEKDHVAMVVGYRR